MFKKISILLFVLTLVSACASNNKTNNQSKENYDVIANEEEANKINNKNNIKEVNVPDRIYFGFDKYNITKESAKLLDIQAEWLKNEPKVTITIEGYCDERGTREYNIALGERRANAAKNYLVKKGIKANRIKTVSYGKEKPLFVGTGEAVWSKNRVAVTVER